MANYTTEQINEIIATYKAAGPEYEDQQAAIEQLADKLGQSVHSIRAVLVGAKIYKSKKYVNKSGKQPITKDNLVNKMEDYFDLMPGRLESLTKANKTVLKWLMKEFIKDRGDPQELFKDYL